MRKNKSAGLSGYPPYPMGPTYDPGLFKAKKLVAIERKVQLCHDGLKELKAKGPGSDPAKHKRDIARHIRLLGMMTGVYEIELKYQQALDIARHHSGEPTVINGERDLENE